MQLKVVVYNKVRKFAGHTIQVVVKDNATVADLKEAIQNETHVPMEIQCIQFAGLKNYLNSQWIVNFSDNSSER